MNAMQRPLGSAMPRLFVTILAGLAIPFAVPAHAQHLSVVQPGGMPGLPVMTGIETTGTNQVRLEWAGPSGVYRLVHKSSLPDAQWQTAGPWNTNRVAVVDALQPMDFFGVLGPSPNYAGSQSCEECHSGIHAEELDTAHAHAFETLQNFELPVVTNGVTNWITGWETTNSCLRCHTVGRNPDPSITQPLPTGFISASVTPYLEGVQCENCHGPGGLHVADPYDLTVRPRVDLAAQVCGGCHQSVPLPAPFPRPTLPHYEDWSASPHVEVVTSSTRCGSCHSGSVRQAYLSGQPLPDAQEALAVPIVCSTCHDPHQHYVRTNVVSGLITTNQLRNPTASFEDYHYNLSQGWDANYNPNINICGQCHNDRNADWQSSSSPPHHSPQYNMLLATVGVLPTNMTPWKATHSGIRFLTNDLNQAIAVTNQCATCHMQTSPYESGPPPVPANTGHRFDIESYQACLGCHQPLADPEVGEETMKYLVEFTAAFIDLETANTISLLDTWGALYAPPDLSTYDVPWEYARAGDLSPSGATSPPSTLQGQIPDQIKKARFNLYIVNYDGSLGTHNPWHALDLLDYAQDLVLETMVVPAE